MGRLKGFPRLVQPEEREDKVQGLGKRDSPY